MEPNQKTSSSSWWWRCEGELDVWWCVAVILGETKQHRNSHVYMKYKLCYRRLSSYWYDLWEINLIHLYLTNISKEGFFPAIFLFSWNLPVAPPSYHHFSTNIPRNYSFITWWVYGSAECGNSVPPGILQYKAPSGILENLKSSAPWVRGRRRGFTKSWVDEKCSCVGEGAISKSASCVQSQWNVCAK